ncbi:MAG: HNH endonuclease [Isosphaeraceae bacterium]
MDPATRSLVRTRAGNRCEYCLIHQAYAELSHHVEHIVAVKHGGSDDAPYILPIRRPTYDP